MRQREPNIMFFFKRKKIHLDCFNKHASIATDNPIKKSSAFIPEWWKRLPKTIPTRTEYGVDLKKPTMRSCLGFTDLYRRGVIMPLWCDLSLKINNNQYSYHSPHPSGRINQHDPDNYIGAFKNKIHFKLVSPWRLREKTGINFVFTSCLWTNVDLIPKMHLMTGIVQYKTNSSCHVNGFALFENQPYQYDLYAGMPLVQIIPLSDAEIVPHIHILNEVEWNALEEHAMPYKFAHWGIHKRKLSKEHKN